MLLPRVRMPATALALNVGDTAEVEYAEEWHEGVETGLENALCTERALRADRRAVHGQSGSREVFFWKTLPSE